MRMQIYTLERDDIIPLEQYLPEEVLGHMSEEGYYTLGAYYYPGGGEVLMGMAQFYADQAVSGEYYAELIHVYVMEEYRRKAVGVRLLKKADFILSGGEIGPFIARISPADTGELTEAELEAFFKECGFIVTKDDVVGVNDNVTRDPEQKRFFRLVGR